MVIIALLLAVAGMVFGWERLWRMPESVSELAYVIPKWLFTVWLSLVGIAMMMPMIDALPVNWSWLCVTWCAGMMAAAATPFYRSYERALHYIGGVSTAVSAVIATGVLCGWLPLWGLLVWLIMVAIKPKSWCLWGEVLIFVLLVAALLR